VAQRSSDPRGEHCSELLAGSEHDAKRHTQPNAVGVAKHVALGIALGERVGIGIGISKHVAIGIALGERVALGLVASR